METLTKVIEKVSEEEYLRLEELAEFKSEYHAGEIVAMAGAQRNHNIIVANIIAALVVCLEDKKCVVYPSDMLLKIPECEKYVYPDITISCEQKEEVDVRKGLDVLLNPTILIEVTSKTTGSFDKIEKLRCYLMLNSLKEYWLVDSEKTEIMSYKRTLNDDWLMHNSADINEKITIGECEILLRNIYKKTSLV